MFGSKLRSWMENHIVRPRKKDRNKQKLGNVNNGTMGASHEAFVVGKKSATLHHKASTMPTSPVLTSSGSSHGVISSPVRRREVSPIQCHTQSRYGWQSPDQDTITSPKSDNLLYAPQRHHYRHHHHHQNQQYDYQQQILDHQQHHLTVETAPNSKNNSNAEKSPAQANCSSSSISSLSWSTGSKEPSMQSGSKVEQIKLEMEPIPKLPNLAHDYNTNKQQEYNITDPNDEYDDPNAVHYEEVGNLLRRDVDTFNSTISQKTINNLTEYQRPHSENLSSYVSITTSNRDEPDNSVQYGRLLPSRLPANASESIESLHVKSECYAPHVPAQAESSCMRFRTQRNGLRGGNVLGHAQVGNVQRPPIGLVAAPPHSLSSPESAYSTGYSTDGTSPGAANYNPPEYYINMRTGTHYFPPKSINSLAIEAQRYKFGLNRIEEMSPMDPLPKTSFGNGPSVHQRVNDLYENSRIPLAIQEVATHKLLESPSPRQRCRIRTNPWYSTNNDASGQHLTPTPPTNPVTSFTTFAPRMTEASVRMEVDATSTTSTTSSGIKSSNELEAAKKHNFRQNEKLTQFGVSTKPYESSESSSSLTEVENEMNARTNSPHTIKRKQYDSLSSPLFKRETGLDISDSRGNQRKEYQEQLFSDDEATLNEMIGKFDESYIYEKETDILSSDSDPTDCVSELDTGQDAGDECDTDELLDIDFIDTSSMQEVLHERRDVQRNLGNCYYYASNSSPTRLSRQNSEHKVSIRSRRTSHSFRLQQESQQIAGKAASQRRRKRFLKTRKKSAENRDKVPPSLPQRMRESRSVGGTPVCLRRNYLNPKERVYKTSPLSNRCNSLVFTDVNEKQFITIAESEKALQRADLEADMKYRQLILEAESLLESMKNSLQSIPRDTPVASPRRLNPLANKRVEMLKNSEVETKKQPLRCNTPDKADLAEHELAAAINKRIEMLKFETTSAPNSPKMGRCSPRKTHLTNFMNQNGQPELQVRKVNTNELYKPPQSPQLQLNGRRIHPQVDTLHSPCLVSKRKNNSFLHNANPNISDSDQECIAILRQSTEDMVNHNFLQEHQDGTKRTEAKVIYNKSDYNNQNVVKSQSQSQSYAYCPHSEPLKRKVYHGSSTFERIKKNFDLSLDMPNHTQVYGTSSIDRQQTLASSVSAKVSMNDVLLVGLKDHSDHHRSSLHNSNNTKQQILLDTIVDLKRSLEYQSFELNGLNGD